MKNNFTIACRGSWLSLAQAELFKNRLHELFPAVSIHTLIIETAGDKNQQTPLHLVEGKDFFTREIQDALLNGQADFAVHSMKDVSSETFFNDNVFAIIGRDNLQDVAIFNPAITGKIANAEEIFIGTSSPRRSNMAVDFLMKALPVLNNSTPKISAKPVRGNVDRRLQKLDDGLYDGLILAVAGLNRLLNYEPARATVSALLANKKLMVLPLFECPPAAGQGAIVAETIFNNTDAVTLLKAMENADLTNAVKAERKYAERYGYGCSQQFGVFHLDLPGANFTYAGGKDAGDEFTEWDFDVPIKREEKNIFSASEYMKEFFEYRFLDRDLFKETNNAFFVASHVAVHSEAIRHSLKTKTVWAAGSHTWFKLAAQGIWVQGCADGLGLENCLSIVNSPLINLDKKDITIITNTVSAEDWMRDGWHATSTYEVKQKFSQAIADKIINAEIIFWTSFLQFDLYRHFVNADAVHCCPIGKTVDLLKKEGVDPVIFPGIKSFNEWINKYTIATSEG